MSMSFVERLKKERANGGSMGAKAAEEPSKVELTFVERLKAQRERERSNRDSAFHALVPAM